MIRSSGKHVMFEMLCAAVVAFVAVAGCSRSQGATPPVRGRVATPPAKPAPPKRQKEFIEAHGLHVTGWIAGGKKSFAHLVDLCNRTELNTLVIDIKDSDGVVSYDTAVPLEREIGASSHAIAHIDDIMKLMADNHIYPIARIAVFKDPILAKKKPELAVLRAGGGIWKDRHGTGWANPYKKEVWDYNIAIAKDAIKHGFKEIQWDYVRFPSDGPVSLAVYPGKTRENESQVVADFLAYAHDKLRDEPVVISADIFGLTSLVKHDMGIGQTIRMIADHVDYICPMVYPSHYALGEYGMPDPDRQPYKTVHLSVGDALKRVKGTKCRIRPWLQDFSLRMHYGPAEVLAQRKAIRELGVKEFLLWNPRVKYTESALSPKTPQKARPRVVRAARKT